MVSVLGAARSGDLYTKLLLSGESNDFTKLTEMAAYFRVQKTYQFLL